VSGICILVCAVNIAGNVSWIREIPQIRQKIKKFDAIYKLFGYGSNLRATWPERCRIGAGTRPGRRGCRPYRATARQPVGRHERPLRVASARLEDLDRAGAANVTAARSRSPPCRRCGLPHVEQTSRRWTAVSGAPYCRTEEERQARRSARSISLSRERFSSATSRR
jgi:hypothetical protein